MSTSTTALRETADARLSDLRMEFLRTSTQSMPIAGMLFWALVAVAALWMSPVRVAYVVLFGSGMIFPLGVVLDRLFYRRMTLSSARNPVVQSFMLSLAVVVLMWPFVIIAARHAADPALIVLGGALLMGVIWIPYGWAADDPAGLRHATGRAVLSYAAFLFAPERYRVSAVAVAVLVCYAYSFFAMRRPPVAERLHGMAAAPVERTSPLEVR